MKKVGYFFASFLPLLITYGMQFLAIFFMLGVAVLFLFPVFPGAQADPGGFSEIYSMMTNTDFNGAIMIIYSILCIAIFGMWYYRSCGGDYLPEARTTFSAMQLCGIIVLIPGSQFLCSYLISFLSVLFPNWLEQYERLMESAGMSGSVTFIIFCYSVILGPINEELIFRGVTMRLARQSLPFWGANILQAILFGILHGNWLQGCYAAALGLLLGFICEKGGSIYYSILMHILFNFWGVVIAELFSDIENTAAAAVLMLVITAVSMAVGLLLFLFGMKRRRAKVYAVKHPQPPQESFPEEQ